MAQLIGEVCIPSELVVPVKTGYVTGKAGTVFMSGSKLYLVGTDGGAAKLVTSAA
jgi:hypothetical protein